MSGTDDYIQTLVDSAPPLTNEQRDRLAVLLRPDMQPSRTRCQSSTPPWTTSSKRYDAPGTWLRTSSISVG